MYPELRLIARITRIEESHPGAPDVLVIVTAPLRNGKTGVFRARALRTDIAGCQTGDDVMLSGEIDDAGTIHLLHGGILRKLAPLPVLSTATDASSPTLSPSPPADPLTPTGAPAANCDTNIPSQRPSATTQPAGPASTNLFTLITRRQTKPPGDVPPQRTKSLSSPGPAPSPAATQQNAKPSTASETDRTPALPTISEFSREKKQNRSLPPVTPSSLAESLQDEIPW